MKQEVTNFARFYAAFNRLPHSGDREEFRRSVVQQYTWGRTDSLREMTRKEYDECCSALEKITGCADRRLVQWQEKKRKRSLVLHQMQLLGVDTADWGEVDRFCLDRRIAGKVFRRLDGEELDALLKKLRAIRRKRETDKNDRT